MQALILAAGTGSRLGKLTKRIPKCLLNINGVSILDYQLSLLTGIAKLRSEDIIVVGGHRIDKLNYLKDEGVTLIYNPRYKEYNNIYSFYIARDFITEDFFLLNGDTLAHKNIFKSLVDSPFNTAFVVDNVKELGSEEMKVLIKDNKIVKFGKDINPKIAQGEYIGYAKFSLEDALVIFDYMEKLIKEGKTSIWYENAINYVLDKIEAFPVYTNGLPWIEIDTPEDYEKAKSLWELIAYEGKTEV